MEVLPLLIVISLAILALAVWLFFRMSNSGQFDDVEGPARRILLDDDRPAAPGGPTGPDRS
jgi:cbb3-type cytochrome oxidase maturation protein